MKVPETTIPPALREHLASLTAQDIDRLRADSVKQIERAAPHRARNLRARIVCETNETMVARIDLFRTRSVVR